MYHKPVLIEESIEGLLINPEGTYVDATFGGGGHSKAILNKLNNKGRLFAIDRDKDAGNNIVDDQRFTFIHGDYKYLKNYLRYYNVTSVDGIIADLGVSSHQFDVKDRGFSFRLGGDLDMRMNNEQDFTAKDILNNYDEKALTDIFKKYSDIKNFSALAKLIVSKRSESTPYNSIEDFLSAIESILPKNKEYKYLAQVFQALRIEVNDEINSLKRFLDDCPDVLNEKSRLVVISYHSLEDKLVKNLIKTGNTDGKVVQDIFGKRNLKFKAINNKVITPNENEIKENNRAKSAKLRIAEKTTNEQREKNN